MAPKKPLETPQGKRSTMVHVRDKSYFVDDLTLAEVSLCEDETGQTWAAASPYNSAKWAMAILTRFLARDIGEDQAKAEVAAYSQRRALSAIELAEDDRPIEYENGIPKVDPKAPTAARVTTGS